MYYSRGNSKAEEAAELYTKAGHSFKIAKKWKGKIKIPTAKYIKMTFQNIMTQMQAMHTLKQLPCTWSWETSLKVHPTTMMQLTHSKRSVEMVINIYYCYYQCFHAVEVLLQFMPFKYFF